jgi:hypothetical protein
VLCADHSASARWRSLLHTETKLQGEFLTVVVKGTTSVDAFLQVLKQVCDSARERKVNHVLVDMLAVKGALSTFERYLVGAELASHIFEQGMHLKIAFVGRRPVLDGFCFLVTQNQGATAELFSSRDDAQNWLRVLPLNRLNLGQELSA